MQGGVAAVVGQHAVDRANVTISAPPLAILSATMSWMVKRSPFSARISASGILTSLAGHALQHRAGILARQGAGKQAGRFRLVRLPSLQHDVLERRSCPWPAGQHGLVEGRCRRRSAGAAARASAATERERARNTGLHENLRAVQLRRIRRICQAARRFGSRRRTARAGEA